MKSQTRTKDPKPTNDRQPSSGSSPTQLKSSDVDDPIERLKDLPPATLASRLQGMENYEFEQFVGDLWTRMGWETEVSQASVDGGVDVIATKETPYRQKKVIQAKRYSENNTVGGPDIQQYASLKSQIEGADSVVVVTTSSFTSSAEERASELNVKLVDGITLATMIDDFSAYDLVVNYLDLPVTGSTPSVANSSELASTERPHNASDSNSATNQEANSDGSSTTEVETDAPVKNMSGDTDPIDDESTATADVMAETSNRVAVNSGGWHYGIIGGTILAAIASIANINALLGFLTLLLPVLVYIDAWSVADQSSGWKPRKWLYAVASILFFVGPPIYLYKRWKIIGV